MASFIASRLASALVAVLGVSLLVFLLIHLIPGDPVEAMLGESSRPADRAELRHALATAQTRGHDAVILRGDPEYYARFGFSAAKTGGLALPGPFERERLLALELRTGALDGASGMIAPTGAAARPPRAHLVRSPRIVAHAA